MTASLRSVGLLTLSALAQLGLQFVLQLMLARWFGAGTEMDAFVAAQALPAVLATILVGSIQPAFVPIFLEIQQRDPLRAAQLARRIGVVLIVVLTLLVAGLSAGARPLVSLLQPGFSDNQIERTAQLLRLLSWHMWGTALAAYFQSLHYSLNSFRLPALALPLGILATFGWTMLQKEPEITDVAFGFAIGGVVSALPLSVLWMRHSWQVKSIAPHHDETMQPKSETRGRDLSRFLRATFPLIGGTLLFKLDPLVDRYLASSLPNGSLAQFGYAARLNAAVMTLAVSGLGVVAFQNMARHAAAGNFHALRDDLRAALRLALLVAWPLMIFVAAFGRPLIRDLLQRGAFTASDTDAVAHLLLLHLGVLAGGIAGELLTRGFFALHDTKTPVWIGSCGFVFGVVLKILLVVEYGVAGLVIATSFVFLVNAFVEYVLLWRLLKRRLTKNVADDDVAKMSSSVTDPLKFHPFQVAEILNGGESLKTWLRAGVASAVGLLAGFGVLQLAPPASGVIAFSLGCLFYALALWLLRDPIMLSAWKQLRHGKFE